MKCAACRRRSPPALVATSAGYTTEEEDAARRKANREALTGFNEGSIEWLVATCCVGMGIEFEREPRAILHLGFPPSAAEYVQEIGRGGRRGGRPRRGEEEGIAHALHSRAPSVWESKSNESESPS